MRAAPSPIASSNGPLRRTRASPCCRVVTILKSDDARGLSGWMDGPVAIDVMRAVRLTERGYRIWTQTIPTDITPKNRLLLGAPMVAASAAVAR